MIIMNQKARGTPAGPYSSTEILNFEESADGHNGGERMEAKVLLCPPGKGENLWFHQSADLGEEQKEQSLQELGLFECGLLEE